MIETNRPGWGCVPFDDEHTTFSLIANVVAAMIFNFIIFCLAVNAALLEKKNNRERRDKYIPRFKISFISEKKTKKLLRRNNNMKILKLFFV
jgi:hypothetical protein